MTGFGRTLSVSTELLLEHNKDIQQCNWRHVNEQHTHIKLIMSFKAEKPNVQNRLPYKRQTKCTKKNRNPFRHRCWRRMDWVPSPVWEDVSVIGEPGGLWTMDWFAGVLGTLLFLFLVHVPNGFAVLLVRHVIFLLNVLVHLIVLSCGSLYLAHVLALFSLFKLAIHRFSLQFTVLARLSSFWLAFHCYSSHFTNLARISPIRFAFY